MDSPSRRALLSASGAAVVGTLAGCIGGSDSPDDSNDSNGSDGNTTGDDRNVSDLDTVALGEAVSGMGGEVTVAEPAVRNALLYEQSADALGLASGTGTHYLLVNVTGGESAPDPSSLVLVTDGVGDYEGAVDVTSGGALRERGMSYRPGEGRTDGWVAFTVPGGVPVEGAAIALGDSGKGWDVPEETVNALAESVPSFTYEAVDYPDRVPSGGSFEVRVTVANESSTDGRLLGSLNVTAPTASATVVDLDVPAGESKTAAQAFGTEVTSGDEVAFSLTTNAGSRTFTVPVGSAENGTNATNGSGNQSA